MNHLFKALAVSTCAALAVLPMVSSAAADLEAQVAQLRAMDPAERRAALKAMSPEQRQGLWFAVKKADWNQPPAGEGFYRNAIQSGSGQGTRSAGGSTRALGTITYDDGVSTVTFGGGAIIGNRFDTYTGVPVLASGTVSAVQAVVQQGPAFTTNSAGFVLLGPQTAGGGAFALFSSFTGATGVTDTVDFNGLNVNYTGNSFFVLFGDFAESYVPAFGTGTVNSQGHHGVVGYTGGMGPNITSTFDFGGTLNGLVRASGNILPVELIEYEVE